MAAHDPALAASHPAVHEHLTLAWDGTRRMETCTLLVFCEEGRFKACLSDREESRVLFRSGDSLAAALEALESCLAEGTADWRPKRQR